MYLLVNCLRHHLDDKETYFPTPQDGKRECLVCEEMPDCVRTDFHRPPPPLSCQFDELQAIAAARSKASQEKLAAERASREAAEKAKRLAFEEKARLNSVKEREALVAKEKKRKREEEERKKMEEERVERENKRQREIKFREAEELAKFKNASQKVRGGEGGERGRAGVEAT